MIENPYTEIMATSVVEIEVAISFEPDGKKGVEGKD